MTDPKRLLLGDGDDEERRLLAAAAAEEPPADGAKRLAIALGVAAAGLGAAGSAQASSGALGKAAGMKLATKIAVVLLLGGGATLAATFSGRAPIAVEKAVQPRQPVVAPDVPPEQAPDSERDAQEASAGTRSIADEVVRLDAARSALSARDPDAALSVLDAYAQRYARGTMRPEAERLRIEAWLARGEAARARSLARDFLRAYPQSPYAAAMRRIAESHVE